MAAWPLAGERNGPIGARVGVAKTEGADVEATSANRGCRWSATSAMMVVCERMMVVCERMMVVCEVVQGKGT